MRRTTALKKLLSDLTVVFNDGDRVPVDFDDNSYATEDGEVFVAPAVRRIYGGNLTGGEEIRIITNTLSHEVEHVRESDLDAKRLFMEANPDMPNVAGAVINILEDQYVDWHRTRRFPGLRGAQAFSVDKLMTRNVRPRIDTLDTEDAMVEGFLQVAYAGFAKGIRDADDDVREFLARARPLIEACRREDDRDARRAIADDVMALFRQYVPDRDAAEEATNDLPDMDILRDEDGEAVQVDLDDVDTQPGSGDDAGEASGEGAQSEGDDDVPGDEQGAGDVGDDDMPGGASGDVADALDEMDEADAEGDVGSWYDLEDDGWQDVDRLDEARYEQVRREVQAEPDDVDRLKDKRDSDAKEHREDAEDPFAPAYKKDSLGENIRGLMEASGLKDEIVTAFRKLKTRDEPMPARSGQRANVRAHNRMLAGNTSARNELYLRQETVEVGDRSVVVVLDMSGSMDEIEGKVATAAIATAARVIGDDFAACAFRSYTSGNVDLVTAPDEKFEFDHLDGTIASGQTPTAHGIEFGRALAKKATKPDKVMLVVTDGSANVGIDKRGYDGGMFDAARQVESARREGVKVIGVGVGSGVDDRDMEMIFDEDGYVRTDMDDLADALVRVYDSQMKVASALN